MQEDTMFDRIHDALDIEPPAGAYERLRIALNQKPVRPYRWPALQTRWSKMGFRLVAGVAMVALAIAILAAVIAIHSASNNQVPAGTGMNIPAYQRMVAKDNDAAQATFSAPCDIGVHTGCLSDATRAIPVVQKWLDDLTQSATPTRFVVVDAEMRNHLAQSLTALHELVAVSQAGDAPGMDRAFTVAVYTAEWTTTVVPGITSSMQVDASTYVALVRSETQTLDACGASCGFNSAASNCVKNNGIPCLLYFDHVASSLAGYQADLIRKAAPTSLAVKDARLQTDLAQGDAVLLPMRLAVAANDQAGFNSGMSQLQRILALIDKDANSILQGP
jgi:hypothetical protein